MNKDVNDLLKALINYLSNFMSYKDKLFKDIIYNAYEEIYMLIQMACETRQVIPNNGKTPKGATNLDWHDRLKEQIMYLLKYKGGK